MKRALILGIGGQDGSYLADILLERGYQVHGLHRHSSVDNLVRIAHCRDRVTLHRGDMLDWQSIRKVISESKPDEIYNVADQDNVAWSNALPIYQKLVTTEAVDNLLDQVYQFDRNIQVFQPLSCTMFGNTPFPQHEETPCDPQSRYAQCKQLAWGRAMSWRDRGVRVSCGIMFNHDSPRRAEGYLLGKICRAAVDIAAGRQKELVLGDLSLRVDIGHARDYMEAAVDMLQLDKSDDYCIGTGEAWTIEQMAYQAFQRRNFTNPGKYIREDKTLIQGTQPTYIADISKAQRDFEFKPKIDVEMLIRMLVDHYK